MLLYKHSEDKNIDGDYYILTLNGKNIILDYLTLEQYEKFISNINDGLSYLVNSFKEYEYTNSIKQIKNVKLSDVENGIHYFYRGKQKIIVVKDNKKIVIRFIKHLKPIISETFIYEIGTHRLIFNDAFLEHSSY